MSDDPAADAEFPDFAELDEWLADARTDAAAAARSRERNLSDQAAEEASIAGVLRDLGERSAHVLVDTVADGHHRARIRAVGRDFVILAAPDAGRAETVVAMDAVEMLRVEDRSAVTGDRADVLEVRMAEVLTTMAVDRPKVLIVTRRGNRVRGELRSTGLDVARVRVDADGHPTAYVPVSAIAELVLLG